MDYRTCAALVRSLADGEEAFWTALRAAPGFDGGTFASFVTRSKLMDWLGPALGDERSRRFLPAGFPEEVETHRRGCRERTTLFTATAQEVQATLAELGIGCLFVKGLYLGQRFYGDVYLRHQADIDLLVRQHDFESALAALGASGFDVATDLDSGKRMTERMGLIRNPVPSRAPHAVRVARGGARLDVHWCLRSRSLHRLEEDALWADRVKFSLGDTTCETLCDDHTLMFLLLSICTDIKRGASKPRHFLDLYLVLRQLEPEMDWEAFFARRAREGLLDVCVNALAVFLILWTCGDRFPQLVRALERRRRRVELRDAESAVFLVERPRGNAQNRVWRRRVYPSSSWRHVAARLTLDLPHTLARLHPSRRFQGSFSVPAWSTERSLEEIGG